MKNLPNGARAIMIGVLLSAGLAAFLGTWFGDSAQRQQLQQVARRQATILGMSLAELVQTQVDADRSDRLGDTIAGWEEAFPERVSEIRVLKLKGAQLLASTKSTDLEGKPLPKRLPREEKPFYDLGQELRTGIDTNRDEGVFRKDEVSLENREDGRLVVTAPFFKGDTLEGVVQLTVTPQLVALPSLDRLFWMMLLLPLVLVACELSLVRHALRGALVAIAGAIMLTTLVWFTSSVLVQYRGARTGIETNMAELYNNAKTTVAELTSQMEISWESASTNTWDTDVFRRPFHFSDGSGVLQQKHIDASLAERAGTLRNSLLINAVLAMALFLFFAMGYAARVWATAVEHRTAYAYVMPAFIGMLVLVFFPFFYGLALSFTGQTLYNTDQSLIDIWVGFDNYVDILADWDVFTRTAEGLTWNYDNFYWTAFITIMWTVCNVTIGVSVGLALALCLNVKTLRGKPIYRAILVLPWAIPTYVTSLIWKGLFHKQFGPINQMLQIIGLEPVSWFDSVFSAFCTGVIVNGWLSFPFMMLISLGGLQSISTDMYEAARLDGASRFQQFRYITLPSLKPTLIPAVIISVVWTFNLFNVIYLVSGGAPGGANEILVTEAYKIAFEKYQYGYAAAYATVIFIILLAYGVFQTKMTKATEDINA